MKYTRNKNNSEFNYMTNKVVNFIDPRLDKAITIGGAAAVGALGAGAAGAIYNNNQAVQNRTPAESKKYMRYADQYNKAYEDWLNDPDRGLIADPSRPLDKKFVNTGNRFIAEDQRLRDKYYNPAVTWGSLAGGALAGGGLAHLLTRGK